MASLANHYHHRDHLGSLRIVTDAGGWQVAAHDYYPFGTSIQVGAAGPTVSRKMFTGHERDASNGLDYMLARYYLPSLARFLSVDPLHGAPDFPQSWNLYAYVRNSPATLVDPTGMEYVNKQGRELRDDIRSQRPASPTGAGTVNKVDAEAEKVKVRVTEKAAFGLYDTATQKLVQGSVQTVKNQPKAVNKLKSKLTQAQLLGSRFVH